MSRIIESAVNGYVVGFYAGFGYGLCAELKRHTYASPPFIIYPMLGGLAGFVIGATVAILDAEFEQNVPAHHIYVINEYDYGY